jgi:hypothetical protein
MAGPLPGASSKLSSLPTYIGMYRPEKQANENLLPGAMDEYYDDDLTCHLDMLSGGWIHDHDCPGNMGVGPRWTCPYEDRSDAQRDLLRFQGRSLLKIIFCNPALAFGHEVMEKQGLLVSHWDLACEMEKFYCPCLGELLFPGLLIDEGWLFTNPILVLLLLTALVLFLSVLVSWLVYQDWAVAWQVAGCFLCIATLASGLIYQYLHCT